MHSEVEIWINNALAALRLSDRSLDSTSSQQVLSATQSRFVNGSPRVWWLGFAARSATYPSETSKLSSLLSDPHAMGWFIPDTERSGSVVYRLTANEADAVVKNCPFFEYYFLDAGEQLLVAETDHNEFIVATPLLDSRP